MSCLLEPFGNIRNLSAIIEWFNFNENNEASDWDSQWWDSWETSEENNNEWLKKCMLRISPTGELMVIAWKSQMAILTKNTLGSSGEDYSNEYTLTWKGEINTEVGDQITDVICLPVIQVKKSNIGMPDWHCVIAGFNSGNVTAFTESGLVLWTQKFGDEAVTSLYCRTYTFRFGAPKYTDNSEEFFVLCKSFGVSIKGIDFLKNLVNFRQKAAKEAAGSRNVETFPPLEYKKFGFPYDQEELNGCLTTGIIPSFLYDQIVHDSLTERNIDFLSASLNIKTLLLTTGTPYFGTIDIEAYIPTNASDLAYEIASKLKESVLSTASGWLRPLTKYTPSETPHWKTISKMPTEFRSYLQDVSRIGYSISLSQNRKLAAITDNFGRVSVIDVFKCYVVRMWKGYRDAQCGFQEVIEDYKDVKRKLTFLIIYAPKRGLLEIWLPQHGPRIAAFNVSKEAKLLYTHHTLFGSPVGSLDPELLFFPVILINPDGKLEVLSIPFHLGLGSKTNSGDKNMYLFRMLKCSFKNHEEDAIEYVRKMTSLNVKSKSIALIKSTMYNYDLPFIEEVIELFNQNLADHSKHKEFNLYYMNLKGLKQLVTFYKNTLEYRQKNSDAHDECEKILATIMLITPDKLHKLCHFDKVDRTESFDVTLSEFIRSFYIPTDYLEEYDEVNIFEMEEFIIKMVVNKNMDLVKISSFVYNWAYANSFIYDDLYNSGLTLDSLSKLLLVAFYNRKSHTVESMLQFAFLLATLSAFSEEKYFNELNLFWKQVQQIIFSWTNLESARLVAYLCHGITRKFHRFYWDMGNSTREELKDVRKICAEFLQFLKTHPHEPTSEWELASNKTVEWPLFIEKTEYLVPVYKFVVENDLPFDVSYSTVFNKGNGYISELIGRYITMSVVDSNEVKALFTALDNIPLMDSSEIETSDDIFEVMHDDIEIIKNKATKKILRKLIPIRKIFPHSLNLCTIQMNVCWELAVLWRKEKHNLHYLERVYKMLDSIDVREVRQRLGSMIWDTFISEVVMMFEGFIRNTSKMPEDEAFSRKVELPSKDFKTFFTIAKKFIRLVNESIPQEINECISDPSIPMKGDALWGCGSPSESSLLYKVCIDKQVAIDKVETECRLVHCISLALDLNISDNALKSIFEEKNGVPFHHLGYATREFFKIALTICIHEMEDSVGLDNINRPYHLMEGLRLAEEFQCEMNYLLNICIIQLLLSGYDYWAREMIYKSTNIDKIVVAATRLIALRIYHRLENCTNQAKMAKFISPRLHDFFTENTEVKILRNPLVSVKESLKTTELLLRYIPPHLEQYEVAELMCKTFNFLQNEPELL